MRELPKCSPHFPYSSHFSKFFTFYRNYHFGVHCTSSICLLKSPVSSAAWYHLVSHLTFHLFRLPLYFDSISFFLTRYHFFYWCISQKFNNQAFLSSTLFPGKRPLNKRGRSQTYTDGPEGFSCPCSRECVHAWWPCRKCFTWSDDFYSTERLFRATKCLALLKIMIFETKYKYSTTCK